MEDITATQMVSDNYLTYGRYVNNGRATVGLDGLKSVERRVLLAVNEEARSKFIRSSAVVGRTLSSWHPHGECLRGNTKIYCLDGTVRTIEDITASGISEVDVLSVDELTKEYVPSKATNFRITKKVTKLIRVTFLDKSKVEVTANHPILTLNRGWVSAEEIMVGDIPHSGSMWNLCDRPYIGAQHYVDINQATQDLSPRYLQGVISVETVTLENAEPVFDFTVDKFENMLIVTDHNEILNTASFLVVHNSSTYDVLCRLVLRGLVEGHGSFGSFLAGDEPAAMRYTSVKARDNLNNLIFKLVPHVESYENEFGFVEPKYLPTPIPFCLVTNGSTGIGVGMLSSIPSFSPKSLYAAFVQDDPTLLKAPKDISIVSADFKKLWEDGEGYVQYGLRCYKEKSDIDEGREVSVIIGSAAIFNPDVTRAFSKEIEEESVYVRDESKEKVRYVISRVKGLKRITDDDVYEIARRAAVKTVFCRIYVSDGEKAKKTPLRDWLKNCWTNFENTLTEYKKVQVDKLLHKIHIYELIPLVYPFLIENKGTKEISGIIKEPMMIIKEIEGKPLRLLRKKDFDEEIKDLQVDIKEIQKLNATDLGEAFISNLIEV